MFLVCLHTHLSASIKMRYCAKIRESNGKYLVDFPKLEGCLTEGNSLEHAKEMAKDALNLWLNPKYGGDSSLPIPTPECHQCDGCYHIDVYPEVQDAIRLHNEKLASNQ
ncbi:MAG: type II toxin-antitoxin system HicB family antitoxin [Pseudomonadota bacterium]|nr:type II toxin-antitoxin system HicB family antitoxin [Pseudomonadota bacterium]